MLNDTPLGENAAGWRAERQAHEFASVHPALLPTLRIDRRPAWSIESSQSSSRYARASVAAAVWCEKSPPIHASSMAGSHATRKLPARVQPDPNGRGISDTLTGAPTCVSPQGSTCSARASTKRCFISSGSFVIEEGAGCAGGIAVHQQSDWRSPTRGRASAHHCRRIPHEAQEDDCGKHCCKGNYDLVKNITGKWHPDLDQRQ